MPDGVRLDCCLVPTQRTNPTTGVRLLEMDGRRLFTLNVISPALSLLSLFPHTLPPCPLTSTSKYTSTHPQMQRPLGLVIYCQPNAGLYEASALIGPVPAAVSLSGDWVGFYTGLGCDVLLYNYRGYGRSQGRCGTCLLVM